MVVNTIHICFLCDNPISLWKELDPDFLKPPPLQQPASNSILLTLIVQISSSEQQK